MSYCRTLTELIASRKEETEKGIVFVLDSEHEKRITYSDLYKIASSLLFCLQKNNFKKGDEVVFQIENNEQFIYSFWACILGGMIPVPITTGITDENNYKLLKIWNILKSPKLITSNGYFNKISDWAKKCGEESSANKLFENCFEFNGEIKNNESGIITFPEENDIAFIQFSSGSTGEPKGVVITHKNVIVNLTAVKDFSKLNRNDVSLSWMPLTHDMGLIGDHIKNVLIDIEQVNMPTSLFVSNPLLWFEKVNEHRASILYSPNFGIKLFMENFDTNSKPNWDLTPVKIIYNGAEPISLEKTQAFLTKLGKYGLKPTAMAPVYGLAESTIAVSFPHPGDEILFHTIDRDKTAIGDKIAEANPGDKNAATFMDVGYPIYNCFVRITDGKNNDLGENHVGYIEISGDNVTKGYYRNKEATSAAFTSDGYFITGDLGFLKNGRLTITGRAKDVIFVSGQNFYAQDIERICEKSLENKTDKVAAVGVFSEKRGCDELILFVHFKDTIEKFAQVAKNLKRIVSKKLSVEAAAIIPIEEFPKTNSGKIQYFKLSSAYQNGDYKNALSKVQSLINLKLENKENCLPQTKTEVELQKLWNNVLQKENIGIYDNFFDVGGDSLKITQLLSRINKHFGLSIEQGELYENPSIAEMAKIIEISENSVKPEDEIKKSDEIKEKYELSYGQESLYFINSFNESSSQYNLYTTLELTGKVDKIALEKSLDAIVKNNDSFRMSFSEENGTPFAKILETAKINFKVTSLENSDNFENDFKNIVDGEILEPFDLSKAPLFRAHLVMKTETKSVLILVVHHIVFDGWSFSILMEQLGFYYKKFIENEDEAFNNSKIGYSDFSKWQKKKSESGGFKKQADFWKKELDGLPLALDLPTDHQRPSENSYRGSIYRTEVSNETLSALKRVCAINGTTLFMTLLSVFEVLLYRETSQNDFAVGTPIANRNKREIEDVIGLFTNNIVLRAKFSGDDTFSDILSKVKTRTIKAFENQDLPFEKVVEGQKIKRESGKNPLFQVFFALQNTPKVNMNLANVKATRHDVDGKTSRFDLSLDITENESGLELAFEYNTDLFENETIKEFSQRYKKLLNVIPSNFNCKVSELDIISESESKLFESVNDNLKVYDYSRPWSALFEKQAKLSPNKIAAESGEESITYFELDKKANRLANYLLSLGVSKDSVVGVYMERGIDMLAALIAVNKAGAAYLPMDPIFPRERLEYMLKDADVNYIISEEMLSESLKTSNAKIIKYDSLKSGITKYPDVSPNVSEAENSLAYLIYTSGSTGKPKGVEIENHSLVNLLQSMKEETKISKNDVLLAVTTLSFDIAGLELYLPLISGAKVIIAKKEEVVDGERLIDYIENKGITFMQATPATWKLLLEAGFNGKHDITVLCGGEAFPRKLADELLLRCKEVFNVYGPTETTIWSTFDKIRSGNERIMIGKPLSNTKVYVLDDNLKKVPVGVLGELYIGGDGVARGYHGLSQLTAEKFIKNPFDLNGSERIYKTGDLVKLNRDGRLEYLSRRDNQVKIRGYRIELGEIETLIEKNQAIKEAVVIDKEIASGEKALVAYLIPSDNNELSSINVEDIKSELRKKLPSYMIPQAFSVLKKFPLTPNGKIDKRALPKPDFSMNAGSNEKTVSANSAQQIVAEIWKDVLNLKEVDSETSFFDLGGHSLLLAKVRSRLQKSFSKEISMTDLFKYPTIRSLTDFLSKERVESERHLQQNQNENLNDKDIAVIGMSGRFPGAKNLNEFWNNLCDGKESISHFSDEEALESGVSRDTLENKNYVKAWGVLDDVYKFDAQFFGYNPTEAKTIDPQQRVFLEEAWKAFEDAGYDTKRCEFPIAVFASVGMNTYATELRESKTGNSLSGDYQIMTGNEKDFIATRTAYKLGLKGTAATVQTACSSSMTALHLACESLKKGECDMALAGGVSIRLPQKQGYMYEEGMILSPDGTCRAFDADAKGTVGGNGVGAVVLKRFNDTVRDGDKIDAVIKGTAANNDGADKIGFTAPSVSGQSMAIKRAFENASVLPETIGYIEAHGTGTPLGDPIEIDSLKSVFKADENKRNSCAIGSVKTNIGHLDAASGIAGFIKSVLILKNKIIPKSLNFYKLNSKIDFNNSPFYVNTETHDWKRGEFPRRVGISSFGIGGTNVHAVLEEAPQRKPDNVNLQNVLVVLSAKDKVALNKMGENLKTFLINNPKTNLINLAYTLQVGRGEFKFRRFFVVGSIKELISVLEIEPVNDNNGVASAPAIVLDDPQNLNLEEVGKAWLNFSQIDYSKLYNTQSVNRISLPTYPFGGEVFKPERKVKKSESIEKEIIDFQGKNSNIDDWFYAPVFTETSSFAKPAKNDDYFTVLILKDSKESEKIVSKFENRRLNVTKVYCGENSGFEESAIFKIDSNKYEHYEMLFKSLVSKTEKPMRIINFLGVSEKEETSIDARYKFSKRLYMSLIFVSRAIGVVASKRDIKLKAVTNNALKVFSNSGGSFEKSLCLGAIRVIPIEYKNVSTQLIDFSAENSDESETLERVIDESYQDEIKTVEFSLDKRFKENFAKAEIISGTRRAAKLKRGGTYIVFGGVGAIGLMIAGVLAKKAVNIVLVSRTKFPEENLWGEYLQTHENDDITSRKIELLKKYKNLGVNVITYSGDVTNTDDMNRLREEVLAKFGELNGVVFAAGISGGGLIQQKEKETPERVFSSKVMGTMKVYKAFKESVTDFFIFISSLNAVTGGFGQSDYCAANIFLNAFARAHDSNKARIIAIDFDRFPGVGIAKGWNNHQKEINPILGKMIENTDNRATFLNTIFPEKDWILSEHEVMSVPTVAGTTYLEMARAAFCELTSQKTMKIKDVIFLSPLAVNYGEKRKVYTILEKKNDGYDFTIVSSDFNKDFEITEHAKGKIEPLQNISSEKRDIEVLKVSCGERTIYNKETANDLSEKFISFGERWRSLSEFTVSKNEGLAKVEMSGKFNADIKNSIKLHPSVLDVATGNMRLAANDDYLPFSYKELSVFKELPNEIYSHITFETDYSKKPEILTGDIEILSFSGELILKIDGFSMKKIDNSKAVFEKHVINSEKYSYLKTVENNNGSGILDEGLTKAEGAVAFERILGGFENSVVIVSTKSLETAIKNANYIEQKNTLQRLSENEKEIEKHPRPELESAYVAPNSETEEKLVLLWEDVLSIEKIGIYDDFFALGGDSLLLIQLHSKLKENFNDELAIVDLYKYNTVASLAKYLSKEEKEDSTPSFETINSRADKQREILRQRRMKMRGRSEN